MSRIKKYLNESKAIVGSNIYYRIQPKGKKIKDHRSYTSGDVYSKGVHVFIEPWQVLEADVPPEFYGDEVLIIKASRAWDDEDVEGVAVDPNSPDTKILDRMSLDKFIVTYYPEVMEIVRKFNITPTKAWNEVDEYFEDFDPDERKHWRKVK